MNGATRSPAYFFAGFLLFLAFLFGAGFVFSSDGLLSDGTVPSAVAPLILAQRAFWAATIRALPAADIFRFFFGFTIGAVGPAGAGFANFAFWTRAFFRFRAFDFFAFGSMALEIPEKTEANSA